MSLATALRSGLRSGIRSGLNPGSGAAAQTTLTVAITDSVDPVITQVNFTYAVVVTNTGAINATDVEAVIALDSTLTYVSGVGTGWTVGHVAGTVTCTRALLVPGAAPTITITVTSAATASTETTTANASAANAAAAPQDNETTVVKLVDRDATSLIRCPSSLTQWQDFCAYHVAIGTVDFPNVTPSSLWLCDQASGNCTDVIGGITLTLSGAGHLFQQPVAGWARLALQTVNGTAGQKWINSTTATNPATTDTMLLGYIGVPVASPAASRDVMGKASAYDLRYNLTGKLRPQFGASADLVTDNRGTVVAAAMQVDNTNAVSACYTSSEKLIDTYALPASAALVWIGGQTAVAGNIQYLYLAEFKNAAARLSAAQVKSQLTALGWSPPWAP